METHNILIMGWEVCPHEFTLEDEEGDVFFRFGDAKNLIETESECEFVSQIAEKFKLNWTMSGWVGDDSDRYFLILGNPEETSFNFKELREIFKQVGPTEKILVAAGLCEKDSFFVGADIYYI